jgi:hypothetical protein
MSMLRWWRELLLVGLSVVIFGGYKLWPSPQPSAPDTKTSTETKQTVKVVTTHPDGTIVDKTTTTEKNSKVLSTNTDKSKYGVGAYVNARDLKDYRADVSARLGNLPLHGVVGYEFKDKTVYVGVRAEF